LTSHWARKRKRKWTKFKDLLKKGGVVAFFCGTNRTRVESGGGGKRERKGGDLLAFFLGKEGTSGKKY